MIAISYILRIIFTHDSIICTNKPCLMLDTILSTLFYTCISRLSHQSPKCHLHYNHLLSTSHVWYLWTWVAKFEGMRRLLLKEILVVDKMKRFLSDVVKAWRQDMKIVGIIWSAEQHLATNDWTHVFRLLHCQGQEMCYHDHRSTPGQQWNICRRGATKICKIF